MIGTSVMKELNDTTFTLQKFKMYLPGLDTRFDESLLVACKLFTVALSTRKIPDCPIRNRPFSTFRKSFQRN